MNDDEPGARRIVICDAASFDGIGAATIARSVADAIGRRGHCALALAGGSTPRRESLSATDASTPAPASRSARRSAVGTNGMSHATTRTGVAACTSAA